MCRSQQRRWCVAVLSSVKSTPGIRCRWSAGVVDRGWNTIHVTMFVRYSVRIVLAIAQSTHNYVGLCYCSHNPSVTMLWIKIGLCRSITENQSAYNNVGMWVAALLDCNCVLEFRGHKFADLDELTPKSTYNNVVNPMGFLPNMALTSSQLLWSLRLVPIHCTHVLTV